VRGGEDEHEGRRNEAITHDNLLCAPGWRGFDRMWRVAGRRCGGMTPANRRSEVWQCRGRLRELRDMIYAATAIYIIKSYG